MEAKNFSFLILQIWQDFFLKLLKLFLLQSAVWSAKQFFSTFESRYISKSFLSRSQKIEQHWRRKLIWFICKRTKVKLNKKWFRIQICIETLTFIWNLVFVIKILLICSCIVNIYYFSENYAFEYANRGE